MLVGFTGFIGKVWLVNTLLDLPEIGRIYLLIRRQKSNPATKRFERVVEESPVFDPLFDRHSFGLSAFLKDKVEVVEGDVSQPGLGIDPKIASRLQQNLDLIINSSGLTDFNPDLRDALATNVDAAVHVLDFVRQSDHCGLVHLSTCYVAGARDGRVSEKLRPNYTPAGVANYDAEQEWRNLHQLVQQAEEKSEGPEVTSELTQQAVGKEHAAKDLHGAALENQIRKGRIRWLRNVFDRGWSAPCRRTGLAQYLHPDQKSCRVADRQPRCRSSSSNRSPCDCGNLSGQTFHWLERGNQYIGVALLPAGHEFPPTALQRAQASRHYPGRLSMPGHDFDRGRRHRTTSRNGVPTGHVCHESLRYGPIDRVDLAGPSQTLSRARRPGILAAPAHGRNPGFEDALQPPVRAGPDGHREIDPAIMAPLPLKKTPLARAERNLEKVDKLVELFEPFILQNEHDFVADNVEKLSTGLVPEERADFGYDTRALDWWDYWINIHIPALRRWTYPLIEGRPLALRPPRSF